MAQGHGVPADPRVPCVTVPILMYHHVGALGPDAPPVVRRYTVTPEQFEEQMAWLEANNYVTIDLHRVEAALLHATPMLDAEAERAGKRPVVITFDDGWGEQHTTAAPILAKHHQTATFFVYTRAVGEGPGVYMSWDQLRALRDAGHAIESHTLTHPRLTEVKDAELAEQLSESKKSLEERLGGTHTVFAYPFGACDERVIAATRAAGYSVAVGTDEHTRHCPGDIMTLGRLTPTSEQTVAQFASLVTSAEATRTAPAPAASPSR